LTARPAARLDAIARRGKDCCGATDRSNHEHAIKMIKMQGGVFGTVADSQALLAALG
jgi:biuret amidohydrolase